MKRLIKFAVFCAALAAVIYVIRDRLVRDAEPLPVQPPRFRTPEAAVAPPRADASSEAVVPQDDLTELTGIGPAYAQRLASSGITSFAGLAAADAAELSGYIDVSESQVADWIEQAKQRS